MCLCMYNRHAIMYLYDSEYITGKSKEPLTDHRKPTVYLAS